MVLARNTISGQIADVSPKMLAHPAFRDVLEEVTPDAKPYVAALYKPKTKSEHKELVRVAEPADTAPQLDDTDEKDDTE